MREQRWRSRCATAGNHLLLTLGTMLRVTWPRVYNLGLAIKRKWMSTDYRVYQLRVQRKPKRPVPHHHPVWQQLEMKLWPLEAHLTHWRVALVLLLVVLGSSAAGALAVKRPSQRSYWDGPSGAAVLLFQLGPISPRGDVALPLRKPSLPTPPTPAATNRTIWVDFDNGLDSYTATQAQNSATPWKTIDKCEQNKAAGDLFYCKGVHTGFGIGRTVTVNGSAVNWVIYKRWPGAATFTLSTGSGHPNDDPAIKFRGSYHWVQGANIAPPAGSNGALFTDLGLGAHHWIIVDCDIPASGTARPAVVREVDNVELYEVRWTGTFGTPVNNANSGDCFITGGCADWKMVRCTFDVLSYHSVMILGEQGITSVVGSNGLIFDCSMNNPPAAGILSNGQQTGMTVEWTRFTNCGITLTGWDQPSRMGLAISSPNGTYRFLNVDGCQRGIEMSSYPYGTSNGQCSNNHVHNFTVGNCQSVGFFLFVGNSTVPDVDCLDNLVEDFIVWRNSQEATNGDIDHDEGIGFWQGHYYPLWISTYASGLWWTTTVLGRNVIRHGLLSHSTSDDRFCKITRLSTAGGDINYTTPAAFVADYPACVNLTYDTDPLFVGLNDFHLQAASPCRNAGVSGGDLGLFDHRYAD